MLWKLPLFSVLLTFNSLIIASAKIYVTEPLDSIPCIVGAECRINWKEDPEATYPLLGDIGKAHLNLYHGDMTKFVVHIATLDVSTIFTQSFTTDNILPGSDYFIAFTPLTPIPMPDNDLPNYIGFSPKFQINANNPLSSPIAPLAQSIPSTSLSTHSLNRSMPGSPSFTPPPSPSHPSQATDPSATTISASVYSSNPTRLSSPSPAVFHSTSLTTSNFALPSKSSMLAVSLNNSASSSVPSLTTTSALATKMVSIVEPVQSVQSLLSRMMTQPSAQMSQAPLPQTPTPSPTEYTTTYCDGILGCLKYTMTR